MPTRWLRRRFAGRADARLFVKMVPDLTLMAGPNRADSIEQRPPVARHIMFMQRIEQRQRCFKAGLRDPQLP